MRNGRLIIRLLQGIGAVWLLLCSLPLMAQNPTPLRDYFRESFTTRDGLPHNSINDIAQSGEGYLWLATWEGAARFDGRSFQVFARGEQTGFTDSGVRTLWLEADGSLVIAGARGGISKVTEGAWTHQPHVGSLINDLFRDGSGQLWLATEGAGLLILGPSGRFETIDTNASAVIYRLEPDPTGGVWLGTDQGLFHYHQGKTRKITVEQGLPAGTIYVMAYDNAQRLLVGTEQGLYRLEQQRFELVHPKLAELGVTSLLRDRQDQLWVGTISSGLFRLSELGLEQLTVEQGLPNNRVLALFEDKEGSVWVGTNGGLMRLRDTPFTTLTIAQGLSDNYVRTLLEHSDGSLWIGSSNGLDRQVGHNIEQIRLPDGKAVPSVLSLAEGPDGDLWVGTYNVGVLRFRQGQLVAHYQRKDGLGSNEVRAILPLNEKDAWFGSSGGLTLLQAGVLKNFTTTDGLPSGFVSALMQQADGTIWIGTGKGLAKYANNKIQEHSLTDLDNAQYIFDFSKVPNSSDFWIATDRGLIFHHADGMSLLGRKQGLPFDKVFSMLRQDNQFFWLSSNRGILRIDQRDVQAVLLGQEAKLSRLDLFGEPDGMQSAQCNGGSSPAATTRKDGSLWFATAQGAVAVDPVRLAAFSVTTPSVVVQSLTANGQVQSDPTLAAGTRRVAFEFAGLSYLMPSRIMYRTKLEGFDHDWVDRATSHSAEYTNLLPGHYKFLVSAAYPDGEWSAPAMMAFTIEPYVWQRLEFLIAIAFLSLALLYAGYHWRIIRIRRKELELAAQIAAQTATLQQQTEQLHVVVEEKTLLAVQLQQQSEAFALQARQDGLTGLANRRAFDERLAQEFNRANRLHHSLCMVMLDIDHFKRINDQWSHVAGDLVLRRIAEIFQKAVRDIDLAARWGGEEFVLLLPQVELAEGVEIAERLRIRLAQTDFSDVAPGLKVTASFGVAVNNGYAHYEKMLSRVDSLLYQAKNQGRDQVCS